MTENEPLKAGDQLACLSENKWSLVTIDRITPSGRIVIGDTTLNPALSVRGGGYSKVYSRVTPEIMNRIKKYVVQEFCRKIAGELIEYIPDLSLDQLRIIVDSILATLKEMIDQCPIERGLNNV